MNDERKYVRLYYSIIDDPKFEAVYGDDAAWAAYTRLLMLADSMWPASPPVPKSCKPGAFRKLVAEGIVDVLPGHKFRIHGLDAERARRKESAVRSATARRTPSERSANAFGVHQLAEPSKAEHSQAESEQDDPVQTYYVLTTRAPRGRALDWCKRLGDQYGYRATSDAMSAAWGESDEVGTLLSRTEDRLVMAGRESERRERAAELARLREKRERRLIEVVTPPSEMTPEEIEAEIARYRAGGNDAA
jgi:hypothetical protein